MCRILNFSNFYKKNDYIDLMLDLEEGNRDGFGYAYVHNGELIVRKWGKSLTKVLRDKSNEVFKHLNDKNFNSITIAHVRACSVGTVKKSSSHPFLIGKDKDNKWKWAGIHNGTWDCDLIKLAMNDIKYTSNTDSEVAFNLIDRIGMKRFTKEVHYGGVFCMLNRSGYLHLSKVSGDLCFQKMPDNSFLIASELDDEEFEDQIEAENGYYCFNPSGQLIQSIPKYKQTKVINCSNLNNKKERDFEKTFNYSDENSFYHKDEIDYWEDKHRVSSFRI